MFKVAVSPKFWATVKAEMQAEEGGRVKIEFDMQFHRLTLPEVQALTERAQTEGTEDNSVDFLMEICTDWRKVGDDEGNALPFSREGMQKLADLGLGSAIITTFKDALPRTRAKN